MSSSGLGRDDLWWAWVQDVNWWKLPTVLIGEVNWNLKFAGMCCVCNLNFWSSILNKDKKNFFYAISAIYQSKEFECINQCGNELEGSEHFQKRLPLIFSSIEFKLSPKLPIKFCRNSKPMHDADSKLTFARLKPMPSLSLEERKLLCGDNFSLRS